MENLYETNSTHHKPWKKALCVLLSVIIAFGTFVTLTVGSSRLQDWFGIQRMLSAYASEIVNTKGAIAVNEESMLADNHIIDLENRDGSNTVYLFSEPISFTDENGDIKTKDISVEKQSDTELKSNGYEYTNGQNDYRINFSTDSNKGLYIEFGDSSYSIIPQTDKKVVGNESTSEILKEEFEDFEYKNIYGEGTNLKFYPQLNGVKDEIVLNSNIGQNVFSFKLTTSNCTAVLNDDGTVSLISNSDKESVQTFSAPFAYDSEYVEGDINEHYTDCSYSLEKAEENTYILSINVDKSWLDSENTVYPITIDPTTVEAKESADAGVYSKYSSNNYGSEQLCCFGKASDYGYGRVYTKFTLPSAIKKGAKINSAYQWMREATGRTTSTYVRPYMVKTSWSESAITWSNKSSYNESYYGTRKNINSKSTDDPDNSYWYKFSIANIVKEWVEGTANHGLAYISEDATSSGAYNWRAFTSRTYSTSKMRPYTVITYTPDETGPTITSVTGNPTDWTKNDVTLTINGAKDNDGGVGLHSTPYSFSTTKDSYSWQSAKTKTFSSNGTVYIRVRDVYGNISAEKAVSITKIDKTAPTYTSVTGNSTKWTKDNVTLTVNGAKDSQSGLHSKPYSFSTVEGSYSWQSGNSKTFSSNGTIYVYIRDAVGNIKQATTQTISKIDKTAPTYTNITPSNSDPEKKSVTVTVNGAKDAGCGLHTKAYSFSDASGTYNWQTSNSKTFEENQKVYIAIRDALGNIKSVNVLSVDGIPPVINNINVTKNEDSGKYTVKIDATNNNNAADELKYSFDGGVNWQTANTKEFDSDVSGMAVSVKDNNNNVVTEAVTVSLPEFYEDNHLIGLVNPDNDGKAIKYKVGEDGVWEEYSAPFALPIGETANIYAKLGDSESMIVKEYSSSAESFLTAYEEQNSDLTITNNDAAFDIARTYNSDTNSWYFSTESNVKASHNSNIYTVTMPDSSVINFAKSGDKFVNKLTDYTFAVDTDKYVVSSDVLIYTYRISDGRLSKVSDAYDHSIDFSYNNGVLQSITVTEGEECREYIVEESNGKLKSITTPLGEKLVCTYENNKLTNVYYDKNSLLFSRENDIILSEYDYAVDKLSMSNKSAVNYDGNKLSSIVSPVGEASVYSYSVKSFNSYNVANVEEDFDVIEVKVNDEITCYNSTLQPVLVISGDSAVIYTYDGNDVDTETEYKKENGSFVEVEEEPSEEEDYSESQSSDDEENAEDVDDTENTENTENAEASNEPVYTYYDDGITVKTETVTETKNGVTTVTVTTYDDSEAHNKISEKVTVTEKDTVTETLTTYRNDGKTDKTVVTTTDSAEKSVETTVYTYDLFGNSKTVSVSTIKEQLTGEGETSISNVCYKYEYDSLNRLVSTELENKIDNTSQIEAEYKYNPLGNAIYEKVDNSVTRTVYDKYAREVQVITDEDYKSEDDSLAENADSYANANVGTRYHYADNGNLKKEINRLNVATYYKYFDNSSTVKTETFDLYKYEYKQNGDVLNIYIGGTTDSDGTYTGGDLYAKYNYDEDTDYLESIEYGNDQTVSYTYNSFGQVTEQRYKADSDSEEVKQFKYQYTPDAQTIEESKLVVKYDYNVSQKTEYSDDLVKIYNLSYDENNKEVLDEYYSYQNVKTEEAENGTSSTSTLKEYVNKNNLVSEHTGKADIFAMNDSKLFSCNYNVEDNSLASTDVLNQNGDKILDTEYSYNEKGYVKEMTTTTSTGIEHKTSYKYDDNGNIKEYSEKLITDKYMPGWYDIHFTYDYDSKGQLRRENKEGEYTRIYSYDNRGNLDKIKVYEYTDGEITEESVIDAEGAFEYDNTAWLDKINIALEMPAFYDSTGNPITIDDCRFNWTNGSQLESMADAATGKVYISYTYDENGIRTSKIDVDRGTTTYYTTIDGRITSQYTIDQNGKKCGEIEFLYDGGDEVIGAVCDGSVYHYIKNASGDVIGIVNSDGDLIASYVYDAWGNPEINIYTSYNSSENKDWYFAYYNPMQYRSYYRDDETNLYYLQSRYYMSLLCRFVNSDLPEIAKNSKNVFAGTNLFAYCCNDPVNNSDPTGTFGTPIQWACAIIGAIVGLPFGKWVANYFGYTSGAKYIAIRAAVVVGGAAIGFIAGKLLIKLVEFYISKNPTIMIKLVSKYGVNTATKMMNLFGSNFFKKMTSGTLISLAKNLSSPKLKLPLSFVKYLYEACKSLGLKVSVDKGHVNTAWSSYHMHVGNKRIHLALAKEAYQWLKRLGL